MNGENNSQITNNNEQKFPIRKLGVFLGLLSILLCPLFASAAEDFSATPVVIDGKGKQREILRYTTTVTNTTKHLVSIYPWITDVDPSVGATGNSDLAGTQGKALSESLARWMEVTRGVIDLLPGEHKEVPVMVQIHLNAKPGMYHALIHLSEGSNRVNAEANRSETQDVQVNIEVEEDINERLQLGMFAPAKNFFSGNTASFNYRIENIGNRGIIPHGKIRIYDDKGEEIATIDANQDGKRLEPSAKAMLGSVWSSGDNFGRYKAMLYLEYGTRGTLQDTAFFWVIPWKKMAGMFTMLVFLCVFAALVLHSYSISRRGGAFAPIPVEPRVRVRTLFDRLGNIWGDDDEEDEVNDAPYDELYETEIPKAVHTLSPVGNTAIVQKPAVWPYDDKKKDHPEGKVHLRPHARTSPLAASTRLAGKETPAVASEHQVRLTKREPKAVSVEHIINLKKM